MKPTVCTIHPDQPLPRIAQLDGVRAFAFLAVFVHHAFSAPFLWAGVDVFFVLSGFLISRILFHEKGRDGAVRRFYARRALRIFPPYYLFLLVYFVVLNPDRAGMAGWYAAYLSNFSELLVAPHPRGLAPTWSLCVEEQFYMLWPWLLLFASGARVVRVCVALTVLALIFRVSVALHLDTFRPAYVLLPGRVDLLALGTLLAAAERWRPRMLEALSGWGWVIGLVSATAFLAAALALPSFRTSANSPLSRLKEARTLGRVPASP